MNQQHTEREIRARQHRLKVIQTDIAELNHPHHETHLLTLCAEIGQIEFTATKGQTARQRARARGQLKEARSKYNRMLNLNSDRLTANQQKLADEITLLESQLVKH